MDFLEPEHHLGREQWGIPETRRQRVLSWNGAIHFVLPLPLWVAAGGLVAAWLTAEPRTWGLAASAAGLLILSGAVSWRAVCLACRPDILICEAGLLLGRTAKCRRELRWEEPFACSWSPRRPRLLVVKMPQQILEYRIPARSRERLAAELSRRGKWAARPG